MTFTETKMLPKKLIEWKEPQEVSQFNFRNRLLPPTRALALIMLRWSMILGSPALYLLWQWQPSAIFPTAFLLAFLNVGFPIILLVQYVFGSKMGVTFAITDKGIERTSVYGTTRFSWAWIKHYHFRVLKEFSGLRCLTIYIESKNTQGESRLAFDPQQVTEAELRRILSEHLPQMPWSYEEATSISAP